MPWHIEKQDNRYCVIKDSDESNEGCHDTRDEAESQMAALYASEDDDDKGNALKTVSKTDTEYRVANYMVLFGGRDLEGVANDRKNGDGSVGEFFTKSTQFDSSYTDLGLLHVDWEHGLAPDGEPDGDDVLGYVDWKTAQIDDKGLFVERVLNRRSQYVQWLEELIEDGLIGNSTEAVSKGVERADTGEITKWPLFRDTLTVSPMEPRMLSENSLAALKALSTRLPALKTYIKQSNHEEPTEKREASGPEADGTPAASNAADGGNSDNCVSDEVKALLLELELLQL